MSVVNIVSVNVLSNPAKFSEPFRFEIAYECVESLPDDLEWKIVYIGSAEDDLKDQVLDTVFVGPVTKSVVKFEFQADPPDPSKIPENDLLGVTAVFLKGSYREKEFVRVGYYVHNYYEDTELAENPPPTPDLDKIMRNILSDKPRVTKFPIDWSDGDVISTTAATEMNSSQLDLVTFIGP
uniref:Anti-silencing factor n=1 Tax=Cyanoptyche gloeocystis TaxID=77922 RepID=A0A7S2NNL2_9EUKA|mmetsp:Transcript_2208/g.4105  ORF Transcript_2208/g.4105 Transcript_2208/m.4105 type:complete len:181 (+) Transcript_2208:61-603(+)